MGYWDRYLDWYLDECFGGVTSRKAFLYYGTNIGDSYFPAGVDAGNSPSVG